MIEVSNLESRPMNGAIALIFILAIIAFLGHVIHNTDIGRKWKSGVALLFIIGINVVIGAFVVLILSYVILYVVSLFYITKDVGVLYLTISILSLIVLPIVFHDIFDGMYLSWKTGSKSQQDGERNPSS